MTNSFEVVPPRLLVAYVRIDACIPRCTRQIFAIPEWNVLAVRTLVALGKTEIDNIYCVFRLVCSSHQEVIRFNITMNDPFLMNNLNSLNHLHCDVKYSFYIEFPPAFLKQIF